MAIEITSHDRNPAALAELIEATLHGGAILDREPQVAHLSALVDIEERENERRRAAWHWLNSVSTGMIDRDNDWSDL
jgi:hypothetical protein